MHRFIGDKLLETSCVAMGGGGGGGGGGPILCARREDITVKVVIKIIEIAMGVGC